MGGGRRRTAGDAQEGARFGPVRSTPGTPPMLTQSPCPNPLLAHPRQLAQSWPGAAGCARAPGAGALGPEAAAGPPPPARQPGPSQHCWWLRSPCTTACQPPARSARARVPTAAWRLRAARADTGPHRLR